MYLSTVSIYILYYYIHIYIYICIYIYIPLSFYLSLSLYLYISNHICILYTYIYIHTYGGFLIGGQVVSNHSYKPFIDGILQFGDLRSPGYITNHFLSGMILQVTMFQYIPTIIHCVPVSFWQFLRISHHISHIFPINYSHKCQNINHMNHTIVNQCYPNINSYPNHNYMAMSQKLGTQTVPKVIAGIAGCLSPICICSEFKKCIP